VLSKLGAMTTALGILCHCPTMLSMKASWIWMSYLPSLDPYVSTKLLKPVGTSPSLRYLFTQLLHAGSPFQFWMHWCSLWPTSSPRNIHSFIELPRNTCHRNNVILLLQSFKQETVGLEGYFQSCLVHLFYHI